MQLDSTEAKVRMVAELTMLVCAFFYLAAAVREARFLGLRMFFENLVSIYQPAASVVRLFVL